MQIRSANSWMRIGRPSHTVDLNAMYCFHLAQTSGKMLRRAAILKASLTTNCDICLTQIVLSGSIYNQNWTTVVAFRRRSGFVSPQDQQT